MKRLFIALILMISISAIGQNKKNMIGLNIGASIPSGDFALIDGNNENAGFALPGLSVDINYNTFLNDHLALALLWGSIANPIDVNELAGYYNSVTNNMTWSVNADNYESGSLLGGLLFCVPLNKVDFTLRGLAGYSYSKSPELRMIGTGKFISITQSEAKAEAFAFCVGTGFRIHLGGVVALNLNADYYSTKPEFDITATSSTGDFVFSTAEQKINAINLTMGIGFKF